MKIVISWFKECDGQFCDMVAQVLLTGTALAVMVHCINLITKAEITYSFLRFFMRKRQSFHMVEEIHHSYYYRF
jgi:hypothetical protein